MKSPRIAILSPSNTPKCETFVQAHKDLLSGSKYNYYGGAVATHLENHGPINKGFTLFYDRIKEQTFGGSDYKLNGIKRSLKCNKIDIVLAEYGLTGLFIGDLCKELKIPLIVTFFGYDASNKEQLEKNKKKYQNLFKNMSYGVAVSQNLIDNLVNIGAPREKLVLSPCGPNDLFFKINPSFTEKIFFALGRFVDKKAPYFTIEAFDFLLKKHPDAKLVMGGDGVLLNACKNIVAHKGIEESVIFLGKITPKESVKWYQKAIAFVQHSLEASNGDSEGTPVAILEAAASGLPIVATRHGGIPYVIENEKIGFLVEERDVKGMAIAMEKLANNYELAKDMGECARINVKKNFSMEKHIGCLNKLIITCSKNK